MKGNPPPLKPEAASGKPLSFKTEMDRKMERWMGKNLWRYHRNAKGRNAGLFFGCPGYLDDGFFYIVHYFIADIFPGRMVCHR